MSISKELLSEVLNKEVFYLSDEYSKKNCIHYKLSKPEYPKQREINIHELAFDKCIEWLWEQGFELWSFRANNIFHVRISNKDIEEKRFYSNPDDKYEAVFQACEWVLKETR